MHQKKLKIKYSKFELAENQLETSIMLFITSSDKFSAITLAGAADVIFSELISRKGLVNFTDHINNVYGSLKSRTQIGKEINDLFFINALKHLDKGESEFVKLNPDECALGALLKCLANYNMFENKKQIIIDGFIGWMMVNLDPAVYNIGFRPK